MLLVRSGACDENDGRQRDPQTDTREGAGEGGILWDQHRGGCPAAWSRAVLSKVDVRGVPFVESGIL